MDPCGGGDVLRVLPFYAAAVWWIGQRNVLATEFIGCTVLLGIGVSCAVWTADGAEPRFVQVLPATSLHSPLGWRWL